MRKALRLFWIIPIASAMALLFFLPSLASTVCKSLIIKAFEKRLRGHVKIEQIHLTWMGPQRFENISFINQDAAGQVEAFDSFVPFWSLSDLKESFRLRNGSFSFPAYGNQKLVDVQAQLEGNEIQAAGSTPQGGSLVLKGKIYSEEDFDVEADLKQVPVGALDQLLQTQTLLYSLLGTTLDLSGKVAYNRGEGTIRLDLASPRVRTSLDGLLSERALTLKEPLEIAIENPVFPVQIYTKKPIILQVSPKNFLMPLRPFSLKEFRIGHASLDLGRIAIANTSALQSLLTLFKAQSSAREVPIWCTPVICQIEGGHLLVGRMDALLADSLHLCTWGEANLIDDELKMFLGLPADALHQAFGLNLSRNYVLKVPISGSLQHPDIDTAGAASKIAAMVASEQLPQAGEKLFGKKGRALGGIMNLLTKPAEDEEVPPPNRPFPWEK